MNEWIRAHPGRFALLGLIVVAAIADVVLVASVRIARKGLDKHRARTDEMRRITEEFDALQAGEPVRVLAKGSSLDSARVNSFAREQKILENIVSTNNNQTQTAGDLIRQTVDINLSAISRERLAEFLNAVEKSDPAIKTGELRITLNSKQASLVDARIQFVAHAPTATQN